MAPEVDPEKLKRARALQLKMKMAAAAQTDGGDDDAAPRGPFRGAGASGDWGYPDPGPVKAVGTKFFQGTTKEGSDEGVGLLARAKFDAGPGRHLRLPDGSEVPVETPEQLQLGAREYERQNQAAADQHWPKLGFLAGMTGEVAGDVALAGRKVISPLYQAATGAARGYFGTKSDDPISQGASTAIGALLGYGAGKAPQLAVAASKTRLAQAIANSRAGQATGEALSSAARWPGEALERLGVRAGRSVLSGAKGLKAEDALSDDAIRVSMDEGVIRPLGTTAGASKRLGKLRDQAGAEYAAIVRELEEGGVQGPMAQDLAEKWMAEYAARYPTEAGNKVVARTFKKEAQNALGTVRPAPGLEGPSAQRMSLTRGEELKRSLQEQARYGKFENTPANKAKQAIASDVRGAIENEVEQAAATTGSARLRQLAGDFRPVKKRLGALIDADEHAYQEAQRISSRKGLPLSEMLAGGTAYSATQDPLKALAIMGGAHLLRTRGPSTAAVASRGLGKGYLWAVNRAPEAFGEFGAVVTGQKTPEAQLAVMQELAERYPQFAEMLEDATQQGDDSRASVLPKSRDERATP